MQGQAAISQHEPKLSIYWITEPQLVPIAQQCADIAALSASLPGGLLFEGVDTTDTHRGVTACPASVRMKMDDSPAPATSVLPQLGGAGTELFTAGQGGHVYYRIPAVAHFEDRGVLLLFVEARNTLPTSPDPDQGWIDIVMRRSPDRGEPGMRVQPACTGVSICVHALCVSVYACASARVPLLHVQERPGDHMFSSTASQTEHIM